MQPSYASAPPQRKKKTVLIVSIVVVVFLLVSGITTAVIVTGGSSNSDRPSSSKDTSTQLYAALANAAHQQRIHVGMFRQTFETDADAAAQRNPNTTLSSVSETDAPKGLYRSVFANNVLREGFQIGRCLNSETYMNNELNNKRKAAATLAEAIPRLKVSPEGDLLKYPATSTFIPCPHIGILPGGVAMARLSDGVMPVNFTDAQAANWAKQVQAAKLFTVTDEGTVERGGKTLRKLSFAPRAADSEVNSQLLQIARAAGELAKQKSADANAEVDYEFQTMNPSLAGVGGVKGYYLIDESTNLPVYSELEGIAGKAVPPQADKGSAKAEGTRSISGHAARSKQSYSYPQELTMDLNTPLEFQK